MENMGLMKLYVSVNLLNNENYCTFMAFKLKVILTQA